MRLMTKLRNEFQDCRHGSRRPSCKADGWLQCADSSHQRPFFECRPCGCVRIKCIMVHQILYQSQDCRQALLFTERYSGISWACSWARNRTPNGTILGSKKLYRLNQLYRPSSSASSISSTGVYSVWMPECLGACECPRTWQSGESGEYASRPKNLFCDFFQSISPSGLTRGGRSRIWG